MTALAPWSGRRVQQARALVAAWLPMTCGRCPRIVDGTEPWVVGHKISRALRPDLMWDPRNWQPEHRACSDGTGQAAVIEKARAEGARAALTGDFSRAEAGGQPPTLPVSPSGRPSGPIEARSGLAWSPDALRRHPWLTEFAEVPEDASPPLWMSPPPADAVGSYGAEAIEWIEWIENKTLRWWQRLAVTRQLEHRADGSLCHRQVVESAPRRAGKSLRIRGMALWRLAIGPDLFGERQLVMHTGSDLAICREIQMHAWRWAENEADWSVTRANGKEAIETPDADRWLVRSQNAVYGYDVTLGVVDEGWDVKPGTVSDGLEPATLERSSPQLHLTSTAHRRATSLMRSELLAALTVEDPTVLLMVWAAPYGSDPSDPAVWRAASPHWTEDRRRMIASKYAKAAAGEDDPELDDPDPMAGFTSQYLNVWQLRKALVAGRGDTVVDEVAWGELRAEVNAGPPAAAAIESWYEAGLSVALAWRLGEGRVVLSVSAHEDLAGAVAAVKASGYRGRVTVGTSLREDPSVRGKLQTHSGEGPVIAAVRELQRLLAEDAVRHDGGEHLTRQVLELRTVDGADGPRMSSSARADAVKAAVWALRDARQPGGRILGIVLPSSATKG
ncbi:HNH endonuclease [Nocardioides sp.]|uniref:HNH endonuclease n=1 Tax=Nocardioides sp. TaxID=35761 RepID=UPI00260A7AC0|nr:HNH endonuclease [Nocardioides sp.]MDI6908643.1 HNH endonuclease [Nocardioides sp.]